MPHTDFDLCTERNRLMYELSVYTHTVIRKLSDNDMYPDTPSKILFVLQIQQPTSLKHLCDIMGISASAGSIMLDKYVKAGLVMRSPDPADRRKVVLSLTEMGTELVDQYTEHLHQNLNDSLKTLTEEENMEFHAALNLVHKYIHRIYPTYFKSSQSNHQ